MSTAPSMHSAVIASVPADPAAGVIVPPPPPPPPAPAPAPAAVAASASAVAVPVISATGAPPPSFNDADLRTLIDRLDDRTFEQAARIVKPDLSAEAAYRALTGAQKEEIDRQGRGYRLDEYERAHPSAAGAAGAVPRVAPIGGRSAGPGLSAGPEAASVRVAPPPPPHATRAADPSHQYSTRLTNQQFEQFIEHLRDKRNEDQTPEWIYNDCAPDRATTFEEFSKSLTTEGKTRIAAIRPFWNYAKEGDGKFRKVEETTAWHRGIRCKKFVQYTQQTGTSNLRYVGGVLGYPFRGFSKSVKKFVDETWAKAHTSDPVYEEFDPSVVDSQNDPEGIGYNPESAASVDATWTHHFTRDSRAYPLPPENRPLVQGRIYRVGRHQFIYTGKGHILFAPEGRSGASFDVAFYQEKSGMAWKNGKELHKQIVLFARGYRMAAPEIAKSGVRNFLIDIKNKRFFAFKKSPDITKGFAEMKGKEIQLGPRFWDAIAPKKKEKKEGALPSMPHPAPAKTRVRSKSK